MIYLSGINPSFPLTDPNPSPELVTLVTFYVQCYIPSVIDVYKKPHLKHSSSHWCNFAKRCIETFGIESEHWATLKKTFLNNPYM